MATPSIQHNTSTGINKCMEVGSHQGMMINEHIMVDSNSYEKVKT